VPAPHRFHSEMRSKEVWVSLCQEFYMPKAAVAGGEIQYEDVGHGEPVVFASRLSDVGRYRAPQVPLFSKHFPLSRDHL